jgi:single-stranded-DNA-specific exonuclease
VLSPVDLRPVERVDAVVGGGALTLELAEELERLGPFGAGNPAPTLLVPAARVEHVTAMGEERRHARFSLASGGTRVRGVAFGVTQAALAREGGAARDVAVSLERDRWRGAVRGRVTLRCTAPTVGGRVVQVGERDFWAAIEHELRCEPSEWWPALASATAAPGELTPSGGANPPRAVRDRRDEGFSGVAGELLTSGEPVLLVVADVARRRAALEERVAGLAAARTLPTISWSDLGADPAAATGFGQVLALDPPPVDEALSLLTPGGAMAHLAWGEAERAFTLACWRAELDLRPPLTELWRTLSAAERLTGEPLERALRGDGIYARGGALAGRLLRVLSELGLVRCDLAARTVEAIAGARRPLDESVTNSAYAARLAAAERHLGVSDAAAPAVATAGDR